MNFHKNLVKINDKIEKLVNEKSLLELQQQEVMDEILNSKSVKEEAILKLKQLELSINHKNSEISDIKVNIELNEKKLLEFKDSEDDSSNIVELTKTLEKIRVELQKLDEKIKEESSKKQNAQSAEELFLEKIAELKIEKSKLEETTKHGLELIDSLSADITDVNEQLARLEMSKDAESLSEEDEQKILENNSKVIAECGERLTTLKMLLSDLDMEKQDCLNEKKKLLLLNKEITKVYVKKLQSLKN